MSGRAAPIGLSIQHPCAASPPAATGSLSLSWSQLDDWLQQGLGLSLSSLISVGMPMETEAIRLRIATKAGTNETHLIIEAVGAGELDRIPLTQRTANLYSFQLHRPKLSMSGAIYRNTNGSYELRIVRGAVGEPGSALPIRAFQSTIPVSVSP